MARVTQICAGESQRRWTEQSGGVFPGRQQGTPAKIWKPEEEVIVKIAQIAPLFESVPPRYYGGTERVVSYLTEELVNQGHEVTLFASGDSVTKAHLVAACRRSLRLDKHCVDQIAHQMLMLEHVFQRAP